MAASYDKIGVNYARLRQPDARIAAQIATALGPAKRVLNVGAGAGSYEPPGRRITAVEPSAEMISQRPPSDATVIQGTAEDLPFEDNSFDAAMAVLTVHHWTDKARGMQELRRVTSGPVVVVTYDPGFRDFWLLRDFPELVALDEAQMPPLDHFAGWLGSVDIAPVPIPHDCSDGFLAAYWRRPAAYLDPKIRAAMSSFWKIDNAEQGLQRLQRDLESGAWVAENGALMDRDACDCGYRIVVAGAGA